MKQHEQPSNTSKSQQDNLRFMDERIQFLDAIREIVHEEVRNKDSPPMVSNSVASLQKDSEQRPRLNLLQSIRDLLRRK